MIARLDTDETDFAKSGPQLLGPFHSLSDLANSVIHDINIFKINSLVPTLDSPFGTLEEKSMCLISCNASHRGFLRDGKGTLLKRIVFGH